MFFVPFWQVLIAFGPKLSKCQKALLEGSGHCGTCLPVPFAGTGCTQPNTPTAVWTDPNVCTVSTRTMAPWAYAFALL